MSLICRPDGKKKAYVRLTSDHDALDVANKVRENIIVLTIDDNQNWWWADWVYLVSLCTVSHVVLEPDFVWCTRHANMMHDRVGRVITYKKL